MIVMVKSENGKEKEEERERERNGICVKKWNEMTGLDRLERESI